jgi:hypothetical protein
MDIYKPLLWYLLQNDTETILNESKFIDAMTDILNKQTNISFYNEY